MYPLTKEEKEWQEHLFEKLSWHDQETRQGVIRSSRRLRTGIADRANERLTHKDALEILHALSKII